MYLQYNVVDTVISPILNFQILDCCLEVRHNIFRKLIITIIT